MTFELTADQIQQLHESWRDIPDAWELIANYDKGRGKMFMVKKLITIRQFERLRQLAAEKKLSVQGLVSDLHRDNIFSFIKPRGAIESYDAIFEKGRQHDLQPKLQAEFDKQIGQLLKSS